MEPLRTIVLLEDPPPLEDQDTPAERSLTGDQYEL